MPSANVAPPSGRVPLFTAFHIDVTAHRDMGKSHFLDLRDATGRIQIYVQAKELGPEAMEIFGLLDLGDFIGVEGSCFVTKTGEPTLKVHKVRSAGEVACGRSRRNGMA